MAITDYLSAYWKLEESSGNRLDSWGSSTLTSNNSVGQTTGIQGSCASFTAASSMFLSMADSAAVSSGNVDFAAMCWVYITNYGASANGQRFFSKDDNGVNREWLLGYETGANKFTCILWSGASGSGFTQVYANTFGAPSINTWYQLWFLHDSVGNTLGIQVNNGTVDTTAASSGIYDGAAPLHIGGYNASAQFVQGRIDEAAIFKGGLPTTAEKTFLYNSGAGRPYGFLAPNAVVQKNQTINRSRFI